MPLPARIPKAPKRSSRWRSQAHTGHVRSFCCAMCGTSTNVQAAHVRMGSGAGMGEKPNDWLTVPLCAGPYANVEGELGCHEVQHAIGEPTFWRRYEKRHGQTVWQLIDELIQSSPKRRDIALAKQERGL